MCSRGSLKFLMYYIISNKYTGLIKRGNNDIQRTGVIPNIALIDSFRAKLHSKVHVSFLCMKKFFWHFWKWYRIKKNFCYHFFYEKKNIIRFLICYFVMIPHLVVTKRNLSIWIDVKFVFLEMGNLHFIIPVYFMDLFSMSLFPTQMRNNAR